ARTCTLSVSFNLPGPPPVLPLFPTRAFSDLACSSACTSASRRAEGGVVPGFFRASPRTEAAARSTALVAMPVQTAPQSRCETGRSEEHTSELQSLTNLVCRLLLEKTNTTTPQ